MTNAFEVLKKFLPSKVAKELKISKFSAGETILSSGTREIFFICKGYVTSIAHYENKEYFPPYRFYPGDIAGVNITLFDHHNWCDYIAVTDAEIIIFPREILEKYLLTNLEAYKYLANSASKKLGKLTKSLYIQVHGGARALFAYGLVEYSTNNEFPFLKFENIAKYLNISRARLYKIEGEFIKKGLTRREHKKILILNREGLKGYYKEFIFME